MADSLRLDELRRRVQRDPASIAFAALAEELRRDGQYQAAIAMCEEGLQRHPAYVSARVTLGRALLESGQYARARVELEEVLRVAPENLAAIRGLAEIHRRGDDRAAAVETVPGHDPGQAAGASAAPGQPLPSPDTALPAASGSHVAENLPAPEPASPWDPQVAPVAAAGPTVLVHAPAHAGPAPSRRPPADFVAVAALESFLSAIRSVQPGPTGAEPPGR